MKKLLSLIAVAVVLAASCTKLGIPKIEFASLSGIFFADNETTPVELKLNLVQDNDIDVKIHVVYRSELKELADAEYTVTFKAGETRAIANIKTDYRSAEQIAAEEPAATLIHVSLTSVPEGCMMGVKLLCALVPSVYKALVYNFESTEGDVLESLTVKVKLANIQKDETFKAERDFKIPAHIYGDGLNLVDCNPFIEVKEGDDFGTMVIKAKSGANDAFKAFVVELDPASAGYIAGDNSDMAVNVIGTPGAKTLATTWTFNGLIDSDEEEGLPLELWYMDYEEDFDACPLKNEGFTLSIVEQDGALKLTPGTTGDFANYYRSCTMTPCAPKNPVVNAITLGKYTAEQDNMFVSEVYGRHQQSIFFELSDANLAFSKDREIFGKGCISISFNGRDEIIVTIHDYTLPTDWWMENEWETELTGFACSFTRAK